METSAKNILASSSLRLHQILIIPVIRQHGPRKQHYAVDFVIPTMNASKGCEKNQKIVQANKIAHLSINETIIVEI